MIIEYELKDGIRCVTTCPFNRRTDDGDKRVIKVGTYDCKRCVYRGKQLGENKIVCLAGPNNTDMDRQIKLYSPEDKLPKHGHWVLAYCNTEGYEDCYAEPEVAWYNESTKEWHTKGGELVTSVNFWFNIPEL